MHLSIWQKSAAFRNDTFLFKIRKCLLTNFSCFISQNGIYEKSGETGGVLTEDLNAKAIVNDHNVCDSKAYYRSTRQCKARITYKLSIPCNAPRQVDISVYVENRCCIFPWWATEWNFALAPYTKFTHRKVPGMNFLKFSECSGGIFIEMFSFTALLQLSFGFTPFIAF